MLKVKVKSVSRVRLFATPWTVAHQAPPSMEFSRQDYRSGLPFPAPGDLPDPGIEPASPAVRATSDPPGKPHCGQGGTQDWKPAGTGLGSSSFKKIHRIPNFASIITFLSDFASPAFFFFN